MASNLANMSSGVNICEIHLKLDNNSIIFGFICIEFFAYYFLHGLIKQIM